MKLFISYAHVDRYRIEELVEILRNAGHDPWFDHKLLPGQDWQQELLNAVLACDVFVYAMTQDSIDSQWCQWEFQQAVKNNKSIMPVLIHKSTTIPNSLSKYQYADFASGPTPTSVAQLIGGIHSLSIRIPVSDLGETIDRPQGIPPQAEATRGIAQRLPLRWIAVLLMIVIAGGGLYVSGALTNNDPTQVAFVATEPERPTDTHTLADELTAVPTKIKTETPIPTKTITPFPNTNLTTDELYNQGIDLRKSGDYQGAIESYTQALFIDPDYAFAYITRGIAYDDLGEYETAIADYDQAIQLDPNYASVYINRGVAYANLGEYETAIADYDQVIQLDPNNVNAYINRGVAYNYLGEHETAIADYDQAIQLDPNDANAYWGLGNVYYNLEQFDLALENYETYLELAGDSASSFIINRVVELRGD